MGKIFRPVRLAMKCEVDRPVRQTVASLLACGQELSSGQIHREGVVVKSVDVLRRP